MALTDDEIARWEALCRAVEDKEVILLKARNRETGLPGAIICRKREVLKRTGINRTSNVLTEGHGKSDFQEKNAFQAASRT